MSSDDIAERLARLEGVEAIRALKARYAALADAKYTPLCQRLAGTELERVARDQAQCFTEDAVWAGGNSFGGDLCGRDQLAKWFMRSPWRFAMHYYTSAQVEVQGDQGHAKWRLWQLAIREENADAIVLAASTQERYRRDVDGQWRCCFMQFEQIHMSSLGLSPMPLVSSPAALDAQHPVRAAAHGGKGAPQGMVSTEESI